MNHTSACRIRACRLLQPCFALAMALLAAGSPAASAREAFVAGSLVILPVVRDGGRVLSLELVIVPGIFPIELELLSVRNSPFPETNVHRAQR